MGHSKVQQAIHRVFSTVAVQYPDQTAVLDDERRVTYRELERQSDQLAHYLGCQGIQRGDRVGIYSNRSIDALVAMLGTLKAGAIYVPFDPSYPEKQLRHMHQDCAPALMFAQASLIADGGTVFWTGAHHDIAHAIAAAQNAGPALPCMGPEDAAYIMYTSGSTGQPKGVLIPHRGVVRLVVDNPFAVMGPDQVHLQLAPLAFDASTFEIWGALLNGARLAVLTTPRPSLDDIAENVARHGVTTLWLTAGLFHLMVDQRLDGLKPLRQLIAGGDVLSPVHVSRAVQELPHCQLINGYGPTENTTFTTTYRIPRDARPTPVPIGTPIARTVVHVLDPTLDPVAEGQDGELYVGGEGVALGYWNRPELTADRFVPDPGEPNGVARMYRTGDRVRRRADGNLEFLGRVDRQVKINGHRVELDEIEACLRRHHQLEDAAVISPPAAEGHSRKVHAFVTMRTGMKLDAGDLRRFVRDALPDHMVPASFTALAELPLSPAGKIDREKLAPPAEAGRPHPATGGNAVEMALMEIWRKVLHRATVDLSDNFFDLGGTSLELIAVHAAIRDTLKSDIAVVDLFQFPSIGSLAARLARSPSGQPSTVESAPAFDSQERARRQQAALSKARHHARRNSR